MSATTPLLLIIRITNHLSITNMAFLFCPSLSVGEGQTLVVHQWFSIQDGTAVPVRFYGVFLCFHNVDRVAVVTLFDWDFHRGGDDRGSAYAMAGTATDVFHFSALPFLPRPRRSGGLGLGGVWESRTRTGILRRHCPAQYRQVCCRACALRRSSIQRTGGAEP